jgi:hypothetical protein
MNHGVHATFHGRTQSCSKVGEKIRAPPPAVDPRPKRQIESKMGIGQK